MRRSDQRPEVKAPPRWRFPDPTRLWLDNGMQLMACHREGQHVAAVSLVLDAPLNTEPVDVEGVATLTQRCLDEGTATHPGPSFAEALEDIGAVLGGSAGFSGSELSIEVPARNLGPALDLLAEAVREPELRADDVERHRRLRLAEIEQTLANSAHRAALGFRAATIPRRYRCSRMVGGSTESVSAITHGDVLSFHERHYRPDGATLIISGDLSGREFGQAASAFSTWTSPAEGYFSHEVPEARTPQCWLIDRPGAVQADIRLGGFGIDRGDPRWADVQVATHALGGAFLSRLNRVLREEKGYTYGAHLVNTPMRDGGLLSLQGSFRTEVVPDALSLARDLLDLTDAPITPAEVVDAVAFTTGVAPLRYSTAQGITDRISALVRDGVNVEFVNANFQALSLVTPESATQSMLELLPPDALTLVVVGDAASLHDELLAEGWPVVLAR
ncbi:M16 family metallopeptidase [Propionicimonas sp.]|uniref:M16 family metallopeptidase n=1 Tax=Propionicimonas sp. TaxID=1955623 RepID=UPI0039E38E3A